MLAETVQTIEIIGRVFAPPYPDQFICFISGIAQNLKVVWDRFVFAVGRYRGTLVCCGKNMEKIEG
jgi:hypothetical protein